MSAETDDIRRELNESMAKLEHATANFRELVSRWSEKGTAPLQPEHAAVSNEPDVPVEADSVQAIRATLDHALEKLDAAEAIFADVLKRISE